MVPDRISPANSQSVPVRVVTSSAGGETDVANMTKGKILSAETLKELDQIRNDPKLEEKIKMALTNLHRKFGTGFKGEAISEIFTMGHNEDTVTLTIKENSQAKQQGTNSFSLKAFVSRFDNPDGSSSKLIMPLTNESSLLNTILLPQTAVDTKAVINDAYKHLYTDWHS